MATQGKTEALNPLIAALFPFAAGSCWGLIGIFVRPLSAAGFSNFQIVLMRCSIAAVILVAVALVGNPHALRIRLRDAWCFLGTSLVSVIFFSMCYYTTIAVSTLSVAAVMMYTAPAFVLVLSRFLFGEKITPVKTLAVVLTILGCALASGMLTGAPQLSLWGLVVGLGSGIGYASYSIFSRFALERGYSSATITAYTFLIAAVASLLFANPVETVGMLAADPQLVALVLGLAISNAVLPYLLYTRGLTYMENGRASVIVSVEIVVATLVGVVLFGESFSLENALGVALILAAVALIGLVGAHKRSE